MGEPASSPSPQPRHSRAYSDVQGEIRTVPELQDEARSAITTALAFMGITPAKKLVFGQDDGGLRVDVILGAADMPRARKWQIGFGRSFASIRIYLVEAK